MMNILKLCKFFEIRFAELKVTVVMRYSKLLNLLLTINNSRILLPAILQHETKLIFFLLFTLKLDGKFFFN